jgi:uncharacterized RDD family membrane protein YckC
MDTHPLSEDAAHEDSAPARSDGEDQASRSVPVSEGAGQSKASNKATKEPRRAHPFQRALAKGVDCFLALSAAALLPAPIGPLLGMIYLVLADGLQFQNFESQSVGKKLLGLQTWNSKSGELATFRESAIRNSPVAVAMFFAMIPVWGWIFFILVGIPLLAIEIFLMIKVEGHQRLGDVMADSEVRAIRRGAAASGGRQTERTNRPPKRKPKKIKD